MKPVFTADHLNFENIIRYPRIEIPAEGVTFINGESGSGKSTLLKLFNGTASPTGGNVYYAGRDIAEMDTIALRKEVLLVGQSVYLFDGSIADNFAEYYGYRDLPAPEEAEMRKFLSLCCADFPLETVCTSMSGGERQRIYLAVCVSFLPKVLMLDEPTSALDTETAEHLMENLKDFCLESQMTLLVVSHDRALTERFADHIVTLKRGV